MDTPLTEVETQKESWEAELAKLIHEWVVRLIKLGEARIPKHGFYVFQCPELEPFVRDLILSDRARLVELIEQEKDYKHGKPSPHSEYQCDCGYYYDDCMCEHNNALDKAIAIIKESERT